MSLPRARRDHGHDDMSVFEYSFKTRPLRKCIAGVFRGDNNNTTDICLTTPRGARPISTTPEIERRRDRIRQEAGAFQACLCDIHSLGDRCRFNLSVVQDNSTVLEKCLESSDEEYPFSHSGTGKNFSCFVRGNQNRPNHMVVCKPIHPHIGVPQRKENRDQYVLDCLSTSLKDISCPVSTTVGPLLTTTAATTQPQIKIAMLVMALLISLLLGVLGTWLGVFCWRRKRKRRRNNRPLSPLMTRPEHASQPNLYDSEYGEDHIYDIVKSDDSPSHPVPDLLCRVPSLPPIGDRTPKSKIQMDPGSGKAGFTKAEDYEPLLRHQTSPDKDNTDPKTPVTSDDPPDYLPLLPDRNSREIPKRVHPYDSINESEVGVEAVDESITTPKIVDSPPKSPKASGNDYFILEQTSLKPDEKTNGSSQQEKHTPEKIKQADIEAMDMENPNDSGFGVSPDCDPQKEGIPERSESDSDGYEVPVPEKPTFDIASSFTSNGPRTNEDVVDV